MTNPTHKRIADGRKWLDKLRDCQLALDSLERVNTDVTETREVLAEAVTQFECWLREYEECPCEPATEGAEHASSTTA